MTETYVRAGKINWSATGSDVRVQERTLAPGQEIPWHYHTVITDKTYCIEGAVRIEMLGPSERVVLVAGESHTVPTNRPHRITPYGDHACRLLLVQGVGKYNRHPIDPNTWEGNKAKDTQYFTDGAAYERYMGRWSLAAGKVFLDWVAPPINARWLDIGCGTGVFTELVLDTCAPATVVAVDPSEAQIDIARNKPLGRRADFRVADAQALPFSDGAFDIVASSLVINFIPDRSQALAEMRRVSHPSGVVAGYVWDFAADRGPGSPIRCGLRQIGANLQTAPGSEATRVQALSSLFMAAGLKDIATRVIDVTMSFSDFNEFWQSQTPGYTPIGKIIAALSEPEREKLIESVRKRLPPGPDGSITYAARAHAIKARVPE